MRVKFVTLCSALALAALSSSAFAADMAAEAPAAYNWSGFYAGVQIGYTAGNVDTIDRNAGGAIAVQATPDFDAFMGGLYAGYNRQTSGNFVFGVDGDINWVSGDSGFETGLDGTGLPTPPNQHRAEVDWDASARVRAGFAMDRLMPYVAGGVAFAGGKFTFDHLNDDAFVNKTMVGWTIGAGVEYAATNSMILRAEYRYTDFGSVSANNFPLYPTEKQTIDMNTHSFRIGLARKF
jgi:outer membrane immunogenic protein